MRQLKLFLIAKVCYDVEDAFTTPAYQSLQDLLLPSHHHFTTLVNLHANVGKSACKCSRVSQWDKYNIDGLVSEVLDP